MDLPKPICLLLGREVGVRVLGVPNECYVRKHATYNRLHAQNGLIFADSLEVIIEYNVALLEPAMGLERICNDAEDNSWKKAVTCEKFKQCEGFEEAEIGSGIEGAKAPECRYQSRGMADAMDYGGRWNAKSAPFNPR